MLQDIARSHPLVVMLNVGFGLEAVVGPPLAKVASGPEVTVVPPYLKVGFVRELPFTM